MTKSKGFANFFALIFIIAIAIICAAIVDNIVKQRLTERVDVIKSELMAKKVESSNTAKVMMCLNEFELAVKRTKFFEINILKSQVNTVNRIESFAKDSYLSKEEIAKLQSENICEVDMVNQSSRQVAGKKTPQKR